MPKARTVVVTLDSGEAVSIRPFSAFDVLEDDRIGQAFATIYDTAQGLGERAFAQYRAAVGAAGLTLDAAAALPEAEALARGLTVPSPSLAQTLAACRAPLAQLVRAALPDRGDAWFRELGADELLRLIAAVYQVNVERYAGKIQETLAQLARSLRGEA